MRLIDADEALGGDPAGLRANPAGVARHVLAESTCGGRTARSPIRRSAATAPARSAGSPTSATAAVEGYAVYRHKPGFEDRDDERGAPGSRGSRARRLKRCATSGRTCSQSTGSRRPESYLLPPDHALFHAAPRHRGARLSAWETGSGCVSLDVGAALSGRVYREKSSIVFEVADEFCPWNEGRWKLEGGLAERTKDEPDLARLARAVARLRTTRAASRSPRFAARGGSPR